MARSLLLHWVILQLQLYIACGMYHRVVKATVGQSVKLPCTYRVTHMSEISVMCWGRGLCPLSKCRNEIVRTDGQKVISSQSDRYRLKGSIARGDVSLTIDNVNHQDRGAYCCRVEIPGPFNDIKENLNLLVNRATTTARPKKTTGRTTTTAPPLTTTAPPLTTTTALPTHSVPTLTTTSNPPTTVPSTATIFQMITPCTEEAELIHPDEVTAIYAVPTSTDRATEGHISTDSSFDTETVPPDTFQVPPETSDMNPNSYVTFSLTPLGDSMKEGLGKGSPMTILISERTEKVDTGFITEGDLSAVTAIYAVPTSTDRATEGHISTDSSFGTETVPPDTFQVPPETSDVNLNSYITFFSTPLGDSMNEELGKETSTDSNIQSQESADYQKEHLKKEIPTIIICVVVTVTLLITLLLVVLLTDKCLRKHQLPCVRMTKSSDLPGDPPKFLNGAERENSLLTLQQVPDNNPPSQGTSNSPVESSI